MDIDIVLFVAGALIVATWAFCLFRFKDFHALLLSLATTIFIVSLCLSYPFLEMLGVVSEHDNFTRTRWYATLVTVAFALKVTFIIYLVRWHLAFQRQMRQFREQAIRQRKEAFAASQLMVQSYQSSINEAKSALNLRDSNL